MSETAPRRVYYDTNIWVAWMLGSTDEFFPKARLLIDNVCSGKNIAIVSNLVILETIHVLRRKITENSQYVGSNRENYDNLERQINKKIRIFIGSIIAMANDKKIFIPKSHLSIAAHHSMVLEKSRSYFGYLRTISICSNCKKRSARRSVQDTCKHCNSANDLIHRYDYKGLGHADLEHVFFARSNYVKEFHSADKSFKGLTKDSDFKSINFKILQSPRFTS